MTRKQAQEALLEGKAITHTFYPGDRFEISEYKDAIMRTIHGSVEKYKTSWKDFWKQHQEDHFRRDWRIVPTMPLGLAIKEAKEAAVKGCLIRHKSWKHDKWIRVVGKHISNGIIWSDGDKFSWELFWETVSSDFYRFDWEIVHVIDKEIIGLKDNPIPTSQIGGRINQETQNHASDAVRYSMASIFAGPWPTISKGWVDDFNKLNHAIEDLNTAIQNTLTPSWHKTYLNVAKEIAKHSKDQDRKVGCVIVKNNSIISFGYNGTPHGFDNSCKDEHGKTKQEVIHAESNAITKCAKSTVSIKGASMYSTLSCCVECAKLIIQCEVEAFYYSESWKDRTGLELLNQAGIATIYIPDL